MSGTKIHFIQNILTTNHPETGKIAIDREGKIVEVASEEAHALSIELHRRKDSIAG